jgi:hypothetical protein
MGIKVLVQPSREDIKKAIKEGDEERAAAA